MLADRPFGGPRVHIELAGGRIAFSSSPALIAYLADCPVIPVVIVRRDDGGYRLISKAPIWPRRFEGNRDERIELATRAVADSLFEEIRRHPHQWYQFVPVGFPVEKLPS